MRCTLVFKHLAVALALALAALPGSAQSGRRQTPPRADPAAPPSGDDSDLTLRTQEILLSVTVRDSAGHTAAGLTRDDFIIAEDGKRQTIEGFSVARVPVNVVLLLDASGSVFSERTAIRRSAANFADGLGPEDKVSVIQFADSVDLIQDWTSDREAIRHSLNWRYKGGESTAFWDAVFLAADTQLAGTEGRRAIILLSDGVDTSSKLTEAQAMGAVDRSGASVYVVSKAQALIEKIQPYAGKSGRIAGTSGRARYAIDVLQAAENRMRALTDRSGGRLYSPLSEADLSSAYGQVADEMKQQYVITYIPTNEARDGGWRTIDVYLARPGLAARTRRGYVAGS